MDVTHIQRTIQSRVRRFDGGVYRNPILAEPQYMDGHSGATVQDVVKELSTEALTMEVQGQRDRRYGGKLLYRKLRMEINWRGG